MNRSDRLFLAAIRFLLATAFIGACLLCQAAVGLGTVRRSVVRCGLARLGGARSGRARRGLVRRGVAGLVR